jgi:hypothetical protein
MTISYHIEIEYTMTNSYHIEIEYHYDTAWSVWEPLRLTTVTSEVVKLSTNIN